MAPTYTFTPPTVIANPRYLDSSSRAQKALFKFFTPLPRGVNVFKLQDGTYVQDTPTAQNADANVPYPMFNAQNLVSRSWNPYTLTETDTPVTNPVVFVYYGGHSVIVSASEAAALTSAGYGADIVVT